MSNEGPKIFIKMLPDNAGWRVYHETGTGRGFYVDVADYADVADYVTSRKPHEGLLDCFPHLKGE